MSKPKKSQPDTSRAVLSFGPALRGDGTAPADFPSYSATRSADGTLAVRCNYRNCGHVGTRPPTVMQCGTTCACECCRLLGGVTVHGITIGRKID